MNRDFWDSLPSDLQDAFDAVAEDAVKQGGQIFQYYENQYTGQCAVNYGHQFLHLDPTEEAKWIALLEPIADDYAAQLDALGYNGSAIIAKAKELAAKNNAVTWLEWIP
jgi:TRAP-type C4-dicarboxylate transport system substrate-binding protein